VTRRELVKVVLAALAAFVAIVLTVAFALADRQGPARCPDGLSAQGARCCGAGQRVSAGRCVGHAVSCATTQTLTPDGCVAPAKHVTYPGGKALLGAPDWEGHEARTQATSAVVTAYELDAYEVTLARYQVCVGAHACDPAPVAGEPGEPVRSVTPGQAEAFCRFAGGRLPTGAEWVLAAMGREARRFPWGSTGLVCRRAGYGMARGPCAEEATGPDLAGSRPDGASPEGAFDLSGNVAEWTEESAGYVARGGSFRSTNAGELKSWSAERTGPRVDVGFRCAYVPRSGSR
jgi:formylglycine-generating enzyme required for sulfatase activity